MATYTLFENKESCCGCSACAEICPKNAIKMIPDKFGFIYPEINSSLCTECGACRSVCAMSTELEEKKPLDVMVGVSQVTDVMQSASGGIFAALASKILDNGGIVFGALMEVIDGRLAPMHISVEDKESLKKLMGSKYVQSSTSGVFGKVKTALCDGRQVLFSGTPCQVAALNSYLKRSYENLYTADIICHGVPSSEFFQKYIEYEENKLGAKITNFKFRDKNVGWGLTAKITYRNNGKEKYKWIPSRASSYYSLFLDSEIYRDCCYSCKYACSSRTGDLTLGDFWGIEKQHPEYLATNGGFVEIKKGCSCITVNTEKGYRLLDSGIKVSESTYEKAAEYNKQLVSPSRKSKNREFILNNFANSGYKAVEQFFVKNNFLKIQIAFLKYRIKRILNLLRLR